MHSLIGEMQGLPPGAARAQALRLESREIFSIRRELLLALYVAVAMVVAGVGLLIRANLDRIGPLVLLGGIFAAAALCYAWSLRVRRAGRARTLGEDYVLLLGALLFSTAVGYAEVQFQVLGAAWSRHLLLLAAWHLATAYLFRSRLVLSVALTAFAGWIGAEARLGSLFDSPRPLLGVGPRALVCAALFWCGSLLHAGERAAAGSGFREVYRQFAANFGFWGALILGADASTRWIGAATLLGFAVVVGRVGFTERRESYLLYAVGYSTIGLIWLESLLLHDYLLSSWAGLATVIGAVALLLRLRARLKASTT